MVKNIMDGGYRDFIRYFESEFRGLAKKFPSPIQWSLMDGKYGVEKPVEMEAEDFDEFRRIELEWKIENEYLAPDGSSSTFVQVGNGVVPIAGSMVKSISEITAFTTEIIVKHPVGTEFIFNVVGSIEYVNKKLRISSE